MQAAPNHAPANGGAARCTGHEPLGRPRCSSRRRRARHTRSFRRAQHTKGARRHQARGAPVPERIAIDGQLGCRVVRVATRPPAGAAFRWSRRLGALLLPARRLGAGRPRPQPRRGGERGRPSPPPPDTGERGCAAGLSSRAGGRAAARHRARAAARDRGRRAGRLALRRPLGGAPAPVGAGLRAPDRPAGRGAGGRATARRPARARPAAPARRRARAVRAASARPQGAPSPLEPLGWDESGTPGSVAYREADLWPVREAEAILLYVGRYTAVKRLPLLVGAHARALERLGRPLPLVLVGGHPGEWEGQHPLATVRALGNDQVFLAGWRPQGLLPQALNAADLLVLPSVAEAFGLVLIEAMACGLPVITTEAHGPAEIVAAGTG